MRFLLIALGVLALAGCSKPEQQAASNETAAAEAGPRKGVDRSHKGEPAPDALFKDGDGDDTSLADFRGAPVLVNLWATWCGPCIKELPTLERLAKRKDAELRVLPISQDSRDQKAVEAFLAYHKIDFPAVQDPKMALSGALGPDAVLPTSILYDAAGREVWRYVGDLDWSGPEAARLLSEAAAPAAATG